MYSVDLTITGKQHMVRSQHWYQILNFHINQIQKFLRSCKRYIGVLPTSELIVFLLWTDTNTSDQWFFLWDCSSTSFRRRASLVLAICSGLWDGYGKDTHKTGSDIITLIPNWYIFSARVCICLGCISNNDDASSRYVRDRKWNSSNAIIYWKSDVL